MLINFLGYDLGNTIAIGLKSYQEPMTGTVMVGRSAHVKMAPEAAAGPTCPIGTVHVHAVDESNSLTEHLRHYQTLELSGNPRSQRRPG